VSPVVYPSDIAPREFLGEPPEPDPEKAFEPEAPRGKPADEASPAPPADEAGLDFPPPEPPVAEEPPVRPAVEYLDPAPVILPLRYPVHIEGVGTLRELAIHGPTLWDIQDWAAGRLRTNYELMARMVGIDPVALGALRWADTETLAAIALTMLPEAMREAIAASKATWKL
jgi:hypothetical protein